MPQDVTFDLPFDIPVSRHLECAQESRDLPQTADRAYPHASADDMVVLMNGLSLALLEQRRTSDPVVAPRLTGRECFLINTAEAATQVLVL
jgi:hypothetical protein